MRIEMVPSVQVTTLGEISGAEREYAVRKIRQLVEVTAGPVLNAQVVIHTDGRRNGPAPVHLEASLDVNGRPVRAHTGASTVTEGVDLLQDRLRRQLARRHERLRTRRRAARPWTGEVRLAAPEELEIVRRKAFSVRAMTSDEAAGEMDLLAHDFYLYLDAETGDHALVLREAGEAGDDDEIHYSVVSDGPTLTEAQAGERLALGGERVLFYRDAATGCPRVLYVRRDGRFGCISQA